MQKTGKLVFIILIILIISSQIKAQPFNYLNEQLKEYEEFYQDIKDLSVNNKNRFNYNLNRIKQCLSQNNNDKAQTYLLSQELLYIKIKNELYILKKEQKTASLSLTQLSQIITANIDTLKAFNIYKEVKDSYKEAKKNIETLSIYKAKKTIEKTINKIQKITGKESEDNPVQR